ncbi:MAG TPA: hypothetical protein VFR85_08040 [Anaeromyxobacteraceae bacterium]|nr:hypothetical protein [Anaeromyxobacteraceae bacterium]
MAALAASALLAASAGCRDWKARVDPARARAEPVQEPLEGARPIEYEKKGFRVRLVPRATYQVTGYAVEKSTKLLDEWDFVVPMDLALAWGPVATPEVLSRLDFHLSRRYVSYRWRGSPPLAAGAIAAHVANNHLIPASEEVERALDEVRVGDVVTLAGKLVDVAVRDAQGRVRFESRTSLLRTDVGSGACEQIWVEAVAVDRPD